MYSSYVFNSLLPLVRRSSFVAWTTGTFAIRQAVDYANIDTNELSLSTKESLEVDKMQYIYVKETFRYLINEFKEGINNEYSA